MIAPDKIHPDEIGLSDLAIRKRRRSHRIARFMLTIAIATAVAGWSLFGSSIFSAIHIKEQSPQLAIVAYAILIISSVTLVLGLWYLLLAQVERLAYMVDADHLDSAEPDPMTDRRCINCGWSYDSPDRFCRHCGRPVGGGVSIRPRTDSEAPE